MIIIECIRRKQTPFKCYTCGTEYPKKTYRGIANRRGWGFAGDCCTKCVRERLEGNTAVFDKATNNLWMVRNENVKDVLNSRLVVNKEMLDRL